MRSFLIVIGLIVTGFMLSFAVESVAKIIFGLLTQAWGG